MNKTFATSVVIVAGALSAAGLARAGGADGPDYPALAPMRSVVSRADVQAAARAADGTPNQWQASADGGAFPALAPMRSVVSRAEVQATARAAAFDARQGQYQASADGALYPALQTAPPSQSSRAEERMFARSRTGASDTGIPQERYRN